MKQYLRCKQLFQDNFEKLQNSKVLIVGVGGVGSYALDCLYRSGVNHITIVDYDVFEITNQNRQIGSEFVGKKKIEVFKKLYPKILVIDKKVDLDWINTFNFNEFDVILDCIDDIKAKIELIKKTHKKLISSMGSAKRVNPLKIKADSIWKTKGDKFAKKVRELLKKDNFKQNFLCVYSDEEPLCKEMGSFVGVSGSFGLSMCSLAVLRILQAKE
jgi:tRNA A37 threonylcarbamoyladenosine dehydratase